MKIYHEEFLKITHSGHTDWKANIPIKHSVKHDDTDWLCNAIREANKDLHPLSYSKLRSQIKHA